MIRSPFTALKILLEECTPGVLKTGQDPIDMTIGEPQHPMPAFVKEVFNEHMEKYGKYPPIPGTESLRQSIADWIGRRYPSLQGKVDPVTDILPLNGSREGLFSACFPAMNRRIFLEKPAVLIPNPFYQCYVAGALSTQADPVFLSATKENAFLPDLGSLGPDLLSRTGILFLCSPSNPEGAIASEGYLKKAIELAKTYNFMLFSDECYSEIYSGPPPAGALEVSYKFFGDYKNILTFNSLSKRSNLPGLRSGFVAGDTEFMKAYSGFRNVACPQMPLPTQYVSEKIWSDEGHVKENRKLYVEKFELVKQILSPCLEVQIPAGGFFLWLDVRKFGGGVHFARYLWEKAGVKVLPGAYLAQQNETAVNPALDYIRVALVQDLKITQDACERMVKVMNEF